MRADKSAWWLGVVGAVLVPAAIWAGNLTVPHHFNAGDVISAAEVNENFAALQDAANVRRASVTFFTGEQKKSWGYNVGGFYDVPGRTATFVKQRPETALHVRYYDVFRSWPEAPVRWTVLFNGAPCSDPGNVVMPRQTYSQPITVETVEGYCRATQAGPLAAGPVALSVRLEPAVVDANSHYDVSTGAAGVQSFIEAEEVLLQ